MEDKIIKFANWLIIQTDEVSNTVGACRRYKNKVYTVKELYDIYAVKELYDI